MRVATGVFDEDFSTGSHGQAHPWPFHDAPGRIQEGRTDPSDAQHVLRREETDRVLRSS